MAIDDKYEDNYSMFGRALNKYLSGVEIADLEQELQEWKECKEVESKDESKVNEN